MVTASGLRFTAMLAVFGFLGFFEVGIGRQSPHPGGGRINVRHGSGQRPQGQASVEDEHERKKPSVESGMTVDEVARATSLLTQSIGEGFYKQLCAEEGY
jgi:hypothetical protein